MGKDIIINCYQGGLGNQMFQYVFGLNLERNGKYVVADTTWYSVDIRSKFSLNKVFPNIVINRDTERVRLLNECISNRWIGTKVLNRFFPITRIKYMERKEFEYDEKVFQTKKIAVMGFWQCHKYVDNVSEKVKKEFTFANGLTSKMRSVLECIENSNAVFLHIRGGDYLSSSDAVKLYGNICTKDYYKKAISMMKGKLHNPLFFIFTNDRSYAESMITGKENMYFISDFISGAYDDWIDLMMMSKCKHAIIANSSFSWWGAWLIENKDKVVIAPEKWLNRKQDFDIWESDWIRI